MFINKESQIAERERERDRHSAKISIHCELNVRAIHWKYSSLANKAILAPIDK